MNLVTFKRYLDEALSANKSLRSQDIARELNLPLTEVELMLDILRWQGHLGSPEALGCDGQCGSCPLRAVCPGSEGMKMDITFTPILPK